jgi:hypothetical protein
MSKELGMTLVGYKKRYQSSGGRTDSQEQPKRRKEICLKCDGSHMVMQCPKRTDQEKGYSLRKWFDLAKTKQAGTASDGGRGSSSSGSSNKKPHTKYVGLSASLQVFSARSVAGNKDDFFESTIRIGVAS